MLMVYMLVGANVVPTGEAKSLKYFEVGEIFMCPELGEEGLSFIPYRVTDNMAYGKGIKIVSERLEV